MMLLNPTFTTWSTLRPITGHIIQVRFRKLIKKFPVINSIGKYDPRHIPEPLFDDVYNYPIEVDPMGTRHAGFWFKKEFQPVAEMGVELMVPDLSDFPLKAYVSHRTPTVEQPALSAKELFNQTYGTELIRKALAGESLQMNVNEQDILNAKLKALQPNADLLEPTKEELEQLHP